jgi:hypothetical protein
VGNLATLPGVRRNHPQPPRRHHGSSPTTSATQAGFLVLKFLGEKKAGGVFQAGIFPVDKNGKGEIFDFVSRRCRARWGGGRSPIRGFGVRAGAEAPNRAAPGWAGGEPGPVNQQAGGE